jgi:hypothetical protein
MQDVTKDWQDMTVQRYMQPVAMHHEHPERLILTDDDARWFLWMGEKDTGPIEIPQSLALFLMDRREMQPLEMRQRMWFVLDDLPLRTWAGTNQDFTEQIFPV